MCRTRRQFRANFPALAVHPYSYNLDIEMPVKPINSYAEFMEIVRTVVLLGTIVFVG